MPEAGLKLYMSSVAKVGRGNLVLWDGIWSVNMHSVIEFWTKQNLNIKRRTDGQTEGHKSHSLQAQPKL